MTTRFLKSLTASVIQFATPPTTPKRLFSLKVLGQRFILLNSAIHKVKKNRTGVSKTLIRGIFIFIHLVDYQVYFEKTTPEKRFFQIVASRNDHESCIQVNPYNATDTTRKVLWNTNYAKCVFINAPQVILTISFDNIKLSGSVFEQNLWNQTLFFMDRNLAMFKIMFENFENTSKRMHNWVGVNFNNVKCDKRILSSRK